MVNFRSVEMRSSFIAGLWVLILVAHAVDKILALPIEAQSTNGSVSESIIIKTEGHPTTSQPETTSKIAEAVCECPGGQCRTDKCARPIVNASDVTSRLKRALSDMQTTRSDLPAPNTKDINLDELPMNTETQQPVNRTGKMEELTVKRSKRVAMVEDVIFKLEEDVSETSAEDNTTETTDKGMSSTVGTHIMEIPRVKRGLTPEELEDIAAEREEEKKTTEMDVDDSEEQDDNDGGEKDYFTSEEIRKMETILGRDKKLYARSLHNETDGQSTTKRQLDPITEDAKVPFKTEEATATTTEDIPINIFQTESYKEEPLQLVAGVQLVLSSGLSKLYVRRRRAIVSSTDKPKTPEPQENNVTFKEEPHLADEQIRKVRSVISKKAETQDGRIATGATEARKGNAIATGATEARKDDAIVTGATEARKDDAIATAATEATKDDAIATGATEARKDDAIATAATETRKDDAIATAATEARKDDAIVTAAAEAMTHHNATANGSTQAKTRDEAIATGTVKAETKTVATNASTTEVTESKKNATEVNTPSSSGPKENVTTSRSPTILGAETTLRHSSTLQQHSSTILTADTTILPANSAKLAAAIDQTGNSSTENSTKLNSSIVNEPRTALGPINVSSIAKNIEILPAPERLVAASNVSTTSVSSSHAPVSNQTAANASKVEAATNSTKIDGKPHQDGPLTEKSHRPHHRHRSYLHNIDTTSSAPNEAKPTESARREKWGMDPNEQALRWQEERRFGSEPKKEDMPDFSNLDIRTLGGNQLDIDPVDITNFDPNKLAHGVRHMNEESNVKKEVEADVLEAPSAASSISSMLFTLAGFLYFVGAYVF